MTDVSLGMESFDRSEYDRADQHFKLVGEKLPPNSVEEMAREVVRRLAFRMPKTAISGSLPGEEDIDQLCHALLSDDEEAANRLMLSVRREGIDIELIYLGYVAGAARKLGEMWNTDEATFVQVTLATGRLYRIIRGMRHIVGPAILDGRDLRPAMLALVPDEDHTLGTEMAADLFRRDGLDVDMSVGLPHDELIEQCEGRNYRVIILVANSDRRIDSMARLVVALRITQPLTRLVVAGNILTENPNLLELVGADDEMPDILTAVPMLRNMLDVSG
ncbi:cobalamin B12-binding domain-containing protein [Yoonia sediminilitoris]|uniref:Methanogenic corrinoid protein MtbC1 n=1 Tax=Yoonia sediminilitoris TaxID=1286148 RepID=A0A2T6KRB6_9RHOB|nr:B12-binding domain-containing protein [Yoonia sediminilitoris]PUB19102.1 methanogenic corrinoid protein MtbC1 [Yoonia sediminilitoris]RCW99270.1 methanogenic corrinoid protein MtbC1 [Yoonia sediminilitoris]